MVDIKEIEINATKNRSIARHIGISYKGIKLKTIASLKIVHKINGKNYIPEPLYTDLINMGLIK